MCSYSEMCQHMKASFLCQSIEFLISPWLYISFGLYIFNQIEEDVNTIFYVFLLVLLVVL